MRKHDIAEIIAGRTGVTYAEAADRVDGVVHQILSDLRRGNKTYLPGLGTFCQDAEGRPQFQRLEGRFGATKS